jgi:hypothetical protein
MRISITATGDRKAGVLSARAGRHARPRITGRPSSAGRRRPARTTALLATALAGGGLATALAGGPVLAQTSTAAHVAAPAQAPNPAPGVTPALATIAPGGSHPPFAVLAYTGTNGTLQLKYSPGTRVTPISLGGHLVGGPAVTLQTGQSGTLGRLDVFGRGTDNALWWDHETASGTWTGWRSLGGSLTSKPSAATDQAGGLISVFVRGTNGSVYSRTLSASGWAPWQYRGAVLLAGTAPSAAYGAHGLLISAVGTDRHVYLYADFAGYAFHDVGAQTTSSAAVTAVHGASGDVAVVFARGTNGALYAKQITNPATNPNGAWTSLGGSLSSGIAATTAAGGAYSTVGALGGDSQFWMRQGTWPSLGGWTRG